MRYWHNLITEKSFKVLKELKRRYKFVLIGGWAVFLYTRGLKSKDIDIIVDFDTLAKLKNELEVFKNERLKKYEAKKENVDIDIYVPFFSSPGLPAEEIQKLALSKEGFLVPPPEVLLILKQETLKSRRGSVKGEKDRLDILSLLASSDINWKKYRDYLDEFNKERLKEELIELLKRTTDTLELDLTRPKMRRLKEKIINQLK